MKRLVLYLLAIVIMAVFAAPAWACGRQAQKTEPSDTVYVVNNHHHTQLLGGKSLHAWHGLWKAALHSRCIDRVDPIDSEDDGSELDKEPPSGEELTGYTGGTPLQ